MKAKHLYLTVAAMLAAGGLWLAWSAWRSNQVASHKSKTIDIKTISENSEPGEDSDRLEAKVSPHRQPTAGQMLRPPDPTRRFTDFTPEQRVEFARKGHGPGG